MLKYSPIVDAWSTVAQLPRCIMGAGVVAFEGHLWILGGVASPMASTFQPCADDVEDDVLIVDVKLGT